VVIVVCIDYTNTEVTDKSNLKYTYKVTFIEGSETKYLETQVDSQTNTVLLNNRHGIRVVFVIDGTIGVFSPMALLRNLVTTLGLLAVSSTITDQLMIKLLPQKKAYKQYKYEKTENFSELRLRSRQESLVLVSSHSYPTLEVLR
jgi:hypothetical protein